MKYSIGFIIFFTFSIKIVCGQLMTADPNNYTDFISSLNPGDSLFLEAGIYKDLLNINGINGTAEEPIVIIGNGMSTVFEGNSCCNTVSLRYCSYIVLRDFKIDGQNIPYIDAVKAEGNTGNWTHNITIDNLHIIGHAANQQTTGISTKCPSWDWTIRNCIIEEAGTGMYLGNSDGEQAFVNGVIEYNLIKNTIGYNMQIKHQNENTRTTAGMTQNGKTIIRHNVFSKAENASSGGSSRPNLLVGNFPSSGNGSDDVYEIYGNFFWQNPTESLFQGTGNISFYNNVAVNDMGGNGIAIQSHFSFKPREIKIFNNTISCNNSWGIRLSDTDEAYSKYIYGNAVFSDHSTPIRIIGGGVSSVEVLDNHSSSIASANNYVNQLSNDLAHLDLYPVSSSSLRGSTIDKSLFLSFTDAELDFNSESKDWAYRGAYSGEGINNFWDLSLNIKEYPEDLTGMYNISAFEENDCQSTLTPNPANNTFEISFNKYQPWLKTYIQASNGIILFEQEIQSQNRINVDISSLSPGIYFVRTETLDCRNIMRLVVN